jgi:hypothetical protein
VCCFVFVFLYNHDVFSEDDLREAFSKFGGVVEVRIFKQQGYAFIRFESKDQACHAICNMVRVCVACFISFISYRIMLTWLDKVFVVVGDVQQMYVCIYALFYNVYLFFLVITTSATRWLVRIWLWRWRECVYSTGEGVCILLCVIICLFRVALVVMSIHSRRHWHSNRRNNIGINIINITVIQLLCSNGKRMLLLLFSIFIYTFFCSYWQQTGAGGAQ